MSWNDYAYAFDQPRYLKRKNAGRLDGLMWHSGRKGATMLKRFTTVLTGAFVAMVLSGGVAHAGVLANYWP